MEDLVFRTISYRPNLEVTKMAVETQWHTIGGCCRAQTLSIRIQEATPDFCIAFTTAAKAVKVPIEFIELDQLPRKCFPGLCEFLQHHLEEVAGWLLMSVSHLPACKFETDLSQIVASRSPYCSLNLLMMVSSSRQFRCRLVLSPF